MSWPWILAFAVLCVLVLANSVVLLGLVRRLTSFMELLENRLHALQFAEELQGLGPGDVVSPFEARDSSDKLVESVALLQNGAVILLTDPGCEPCDQLAEELQRATVATGFPVYIVSEGADRYVGRFQAPLQTLYQQERKVATAFRSSITPQAFAVDDNHVIVGRSVPQSVADLNRLIEQLQAVRGGSQSDVPQVIR